MADIILATVNARYSHSSLGLRWLMANLGDLAGRAEIREFTLDDKPADVAEQILEKGPRVVGLGVYIWNAELLGQVARIIKALRPDVAVVLGGPEVSHEIEQQEIATLADHVISGQGELVFPSLAGDLLDGRPRHDKVIAAEPPDPEILTLPYDLYDENDISNRTIYIEASRGCPFGCEFCLASLERKVRRFPADRVLDAIGGLWRRGARSFKFVDRALHLAITPELIGFFLDRIEPGLFLHFELVPDHLPGKLLELFSGFPPGTVQLEAGVQTLDPEVAERIGRRQEMDKVLDNLRRLRAETGVHVHADLVVGLPGESQESFARGFDRLFEVGLQEIQVGILKRLRGAPIRRHDGSFGMIYNPRPPYDILQNRHIDFHAMQRLKRFAGYFDMVHNSGNFVSSVPLITRGRSPFAAFMDLTEWLFGKTGRTHSISLGRLVELLFSYMTSREGVDASEAANSLYADFTRMGRRGFPGSVFSHVTAKDEPQRKKSGPDVPARQRRHASASDTN